jgi:hypothetical protein
MQVDQVHPKSYLAGCLNGDAYLTKANYFGLSAKDEDFAQMFAECVQQSYGFNLKVRQAKGGFYVAQRYNGNGVFNDLVEYVPSRPIQMASWIRGVFDSDGSAVIGECKRKRSNPKYRVIVICMSYREILERVRDYLGQLGIKSVIDTDKMHASHRGTRQMYRVRITGGRPCIELFARLIGSSIARKAAKLNEMVATYCNRIDESRKGQLLGASSKNANRNAIVVPYVVGKIKELASNKATGRATGRECKSIKGYTGLLKYFTHCSLLEMAQKEAS